ncbi:MAG: alpha/beta hydrolase [Actinobacteria bacterium]|nr:alpha/beta hydrolase [Actinomycetota bacterium]
MPSIRSHIARIFVRLNSTLMLGGRCPVSYQRFLFSEVVPRLAVKTAGVRNEPADIPGMQAEWLIPESAVDDRAILYLHGGGYVIGSISSHRSLASQLASAAQSRVLIIDYRLAPENGFPSAVDDAVASYRWLLSQGYKPWQTGIAGDSAGGGLAAATLVSLRDSGEPLPAAAMMLSPWADLELKGASCRTVGWRDPLVSGYALRKWAAMYLGGADPRDPLASPIYADLKGLPPLCIHAGTREILLDDARRLADRAREDGVRVDLDVCEGMFHVYQFFSPLVPESREAIKKLAGFFRDKTAEGAGSAA